MSERPSEPRLLPLLGDPPPERSDAARNREALLVAAREIVEQCGYDALTMDAVAARAGAATAVAAGTATEARCAGRTTGL